MTEGDLEALRLPSRRADLVRPLRDSLHMVARLFASGLKLHEIAERTGYSISRLSALRSAPTMVESIERYRSMVTDAWREEVDSFQATALANMRKAERQISDKLDDADEAGETLPVRELIAITSDRMDRFGYGKKSMNLNVNVDFAAKLEAAHQRLEAERKRKVAAE